MRTYTKEDFDRYLVENYEYLLSINNDHDIVDYVIDYTYSRLPLMVANLTGYLQRAIYRNSTSRLSPYQYQIIQPHITKVEYSEAIGTLTDDEPMDYTFQEKLMSEVYSALDSISVTERERQIFIDLKIEGMDSDEAMLKYKISKSELQKVSKSVTRLIKNYINNNYNGYYEEKDNGEQKADSKTSQG